MQPNLGSLVIELVVSLAILIAGLIWISRNNSSDQPVDQGVIPDTTMVIEGDTLARQFVIDQ